MIDPKGQTIRALDVFFIGPVMILGGLEAGKRRPLLGSLLALAGVGTIIFNAENYQKIRALEAAQKQRG